MRKNKPAYDDNWFGDWDFFNIKGILYFISLTAFGFIILWALFFRGGGTWDVKESIRKNKNHIKVTTLAEIPKGAFVHRIVDTKLRKVCYLNAVGGGIQCFDLDTETYEDLKLLEELEKEANGVRVRRVPAYDYTKGYNND